MLAPGGLAAALGVCASSRALGTCLTTAAVDPRPGCKHACTLVYLHGYTRSGEEYLPDGRLAFCMPWVPGGDRAPGLRAVLPTAEYLHQPWGEVEPAWYRYAHPEQNHCGDGASLDATRRRLRALLRDEIKRLDGASHRVFLGGSSQGCTAALDVYLREASPLKLGGFVGSTGFIPRNKLGFHGASRALQSLIEDKEQAQRPLWIQCASDDQTFVPWYDLVMPGLRLVEDKLPGLIVRVVEGRGHSIEDWEGHIINDFMREHASEAYG